MLHLVRGLPGTGKTTVAVARALDAAAGRPVLALAPSAAGVADIGAALAARGAKGGSDPNFTPSTVQQLARGLVDEMAHEVGVWDPRIVGNSAVVQLMVDNLDDLPLERLKPSRDPGQALAGLAAVYARLKMSCVAPEAAREHVLAELAALEADGKTTKAAAAERRRWQGLLEVADTFAVYETLKADRGWLDHADVLHLAARLAEDESIYARTWGAAFDHVLLDGAHALLPATAAVVRPLLQRMPGTVVRADHDARPRAAVDLRSLGLPFDAAQETVLEQPRRGTPALHAAAAAVLRGSPAAASEHLQFPSMGQEVAAVADLGADAILVCKRALLRPVRDALLERGVPVYCPDLAGRAIFRMEPVRLAMSALRWLLDPEDEPALYHVLAAPPLLVPPSQLAAWAAADTPLWEAARDGSAAVRDLFAGLGAVSGEGVQAIVLHFLRETGRLGDWLAPRSALEAANASCVASFLETVAMAEAAVGSDQLGLVLPQLEMMRAQGMAANDSGPPGQGEVPLLLLEQAARLPAGGVDTLVVVGATEAALPGRNVQPRFALPGLVPSDRRTPAQTLAACREQLASAMSRANSRLVVTSAASYPYSVVAQAPASAFFEPPTPASGAATAAAPFALTPTIDPSEELPLSYSRIEAYRRCPRMYHYRYRVGLHFQGSSIMRYGSAMHAAVEWCAREVQAGRRPELEGALRQLTGVEGPQLQRQAEEGLRSFLSRFSSPDAPYPEILEVESQFAVHVPGPNVRLIGVIDRLDADPAGGGAVVKEYKSNTGDRDMAAAARKSTQLALYALAYSLQHGGALPVRCDLEGIESGAVGSVVPDADMVREALGAVETAARGIRAGEFRATPGAGACSFCAFQHVCPSSSF